MGLVLQLNRRFTKGLQFNANYTLSDAEDNGQSSLTFAPFSGNVPSDPNDLSLQDGKSRFHTPHRFVANFVYAPETLFGLGKGNKTAEAILRNWSFAPIVTIQSGRTYSAGLSSDLWGANGDRIYPGVERNGFNQPYLANFDMRLSRRFNFSETKSLEFFVEGFNVFNRQNITRVDTRAYNRSGTDLNFNSNFGAARGAGNNSFRERQVQISGRFRF